MKIMLEFHCDDCDKNFEKIVENGTIETRCLTCGTNCVKIFPTKMRFELKGGSWFANSYDKAK